MVHGLLIASLFVAHEALGHRGSVAAAPRLQGCLIRFSCVQLFVTQWTIAHQAPLSKGFSREEYWSRLPCPPPGDLLSPGIEPVSLMSPALAGISFTTSATWEAPWVLEHRLSSWGTWASLLHGMWNLPGAGIKPVFPELAGGVFTTEPSEKPLSLLLAYMISTLLSITDTIFYSMSLNLSFLALPRA